MSPGEVRSLLIRMMDSKRRFLLSESTRVNDPRIIVPADPGVTGICQIAQIVEGATCTYKAKHWHNNVGICGIHLKKVNRRPDPPPCEAAEITDRFKECTARGSINYKNRPVCYKHYNLLRGSLGEKTQHEIWQSRRS